MILRSYVLHSALQYHPDTAPEQHTNGLDPATKFRAIAEAWAILSKPDIKLKYDSERGHYVRSLVKKKFSVEVSTSSPPMSFVDADNISTSFTTQRDKFSKIRHLASSNWEDIRSKYKSEKWQKTPLYAKKVRR
jgi:curved DNA-binding protein CbpA